MLKTIKYLYWDLKSAFVENVFHFWRAKKDRGFVVCIFRGMRTEKERQEYLTKLNFMEKHLSFPIINKQEGNE